MPRRRKVKSEDDPEVNHLDLESLLFLASQLAYKSDQQSTKEKFERIENSYARYIIALNCDDSEFAQRAAVLRRQIQIFIKSLNN